MLISSNFWNQFALYVSVILMGSLIWGCNESEDDRPGLRDGSYQSVKSDFNNCSIRSSQERVITFNKRDGGPIGHIRNVEKVGNRFLISSEGDPVLLFDKNGEEISAIGGWGGGPTEYSNNYDFDANKNGTVVIVDKSKDMIKIYDIRSGFINDFPLRDFDDLDHSKISNIAVDNKDNIYILNKEIVKSNFSLIKIAKNNSVEFSEGTVPTIAGLQKFLAGGGLDVDSKSGNIYYSYMGDFSIFKRSGHGEEMAMFRRKPPYFQSPDIGYIQRILDRPLQEQSRPMIKHAFTKSRIYAIEHVRMEDGSYIFQNIGTPSASDDSIMYYLEIWESNGIDIGSQINVPSIMIEATDKFWYFTNPINSREDRYGLYEYRYSIDCER